MPHCSENWHGWRDVSLADEEGYRTFSEYSLVEEVVRQKGCRNAIHAEVNAVAFAARVGNSTEGGTLYVTISPCEQCSRLLISAGMVRGVFSQTYRDE